MFSSINYLKLSEISFKSSERVPGDRDAQLIYLEEATYPVWLLRQGESINLTEETPYDEQANDFYDDY